MTEEENPGFGWGWGRGWGWGGGGEEEEERSGVLCGGRMKMELLEKGIKWGREARLVANIPRVERKRQKPDHTNR